MDQNEVKKRIIAAQKLLLEDATTRQKFESIRELIKGINPRLDTLLMQMSKSLSDYEKLQKGEIITLTAEHLPENTEEEKRRKRALLLLIKNIKELRSEVERVKAEFENAENGQGKVETGIQILGGAKGPLGIISILAVIVVVSYVLFTLQTSKKQQVPTVPEITPIIEVSQPSTVQVVDYNGKQIPLTELEARTGADCDREPHYHAKNGQNVTALDGSVIVDPGSCAFGKVKNTQIRNVPH